MISRNKIILKILTTHKRIKIATLAELLDVPQITIRKDLYSLEKQGDVKIVPVNTVTKAK